MHKPDYLARQAISTVDKQKKMFILLQESLLPIRSYFTWTKTKRNFLREIIIFKWKRTNRKKDISKWDTNLYKTI